MAKALLDYNIHAPTMYFPLIVPECLLIEPTETESLAQLDEFLEAMADIRKRMMSEPEALKSAPHQFNCQRPDEALAAKSLNVRWIGEDL